AMLGHRTHGVPIVQADAGPVRVKPVNPGGLQVAAAGNEIFSGGSDTTVGKLAPPPETPDLQALRAPPPPPPVHKPAEAPVAAAIPPAAPKAAAPVVQPAKPTVAAATPADRHAASPPAHAGKNPLVQLAALSSEQAARTEWDILARR